MSSNHVAVLARTELPGVLDCKKPEQLEADRRAGVDPSARARQPAGFSQIPVPPYDRELPPSYWQNLGPAKVNPPKRERGHWLKAAGFLALALGALSLITAKTLNQADFPPPQVPHLRPNPAPVARAVAPRAALVKSPPRVRRAELVVPQAGTSYWAELPDGRRIVINYLGEVSDYAHLPVQHGINNAAYHSRADGNTWIWTVPMDSNVAQWIDP